MSVVIEQNQQFGLVTWRAPISTAPCVGTLHFWLQYVVYGFYDMCFNGLVGKCRYAPQLYYYLHVAHAQSWNRNATTRSGKVKLSLGPSSWDLRTWPFLHPTTSQGLRFTIPTDSQPSILSEYFFFFPTLLPGPDSCMCEHVCVRAHPLIHSPPGWSPGSTT